MARVSFEAWDKLSEGALAVLDEASNRLGVLRGIGRQLRNPHLLISPYIRREAVLGSRIEGTQTTDAIYDLLRGK